MSRKAVSSRRVSAGADGRAHATEVLRAVQANCKKHERARLSHSGSAVARSVVERKETDVCGWAGGLR